MAVCALCGKVVATVTREHVPPRSLFGDNRNHQLITVPACAKCNSEASKDDEYFKILAVEWDASAHPIAARVMDSIRRSLQRPQQQGYRSHLFGSTVPVDLCTASGLFIKPGGQLNADATRLSRTATKIVKGLYYHHQGFPVPKGYFAYCHFLDFILAGWPSELVQELEEVILPPVAAQPAIIIGPEVFCYRMGRLECDPNVLFFLWELWNRYQFFGFTARKTQSEPDGSGC